MSLNAMNTFENDENVPEGYGPENCGPFERPSFRWEEELKRYELPTMEFSKNGKKKEGVEVFGSTGHLPEGHGSLERPSEGLDLLLCETRKRVEVTLST